MVKEDLLLALPLKLKRQKRSCNGAQNTKVGISNNLIVNVTEDKVFNPRTYNVLDTITKDSA